MPPKKVDEDPSRAVVGSRVKRSTRRGSDANRPARQTPRRRTPDPAGQFGVFQAHISHASDHQASSTTSMALQTPASVTAHLAKQFGLSTHGQPYSTNQQFLQPYMYDHPRWYQTHQRALEAAHKFESRSTAMALCSQEIWGTSMTSAQQLSLEAIFCITYVLADVALLYGQTSSNQTSGQGEKVASLECIAHLGESLAHCVLNVGSHSYWYDSWGSSTATEALQKKDLMEHRCESMHSPIAVLGLVSMIACPIMSMGATNHGHLAGIVQQHADDERNDLGHCEAELANLCIRDCLPASLGATELQARHRKLNDIGKNLPHASTSAVDDPANAQRLNEQFKGPSYYKRTTDPHEAIFHPYQDHLQALLFDLDKQMPNTRARCESVLSHCVCGAGSLRYHLIRNLSKAACDKAGLALTSAMENGCQEAKRHRESSERARETAIREAKQQRDFQFADYWKVAGAARAFAKLLEDLANRQPGLSDEDLSQLLEGIRAANLFAQRTAKAVLKLMEMDLKLDQQRARKAETQLLSSISRFKDGFDRRPAATGR